MSMQRLKIAALLASMVTLAVTTPGMAQAAVTTVQPGQSMWKIAQANHTSVQSLEAANPSINPANLQVGSTVQLPQTQYTVHFGDTLWLVARKFGISENALQDANPHVLASNLLVGTKLTVPVSSAPMHASVPVKYAAPSTPAASSTSTASSTSAASNTDLYWMSRIISAEARGESQSAQIGVGDVVWNRVMSPDYPNTVKDVVFQVDGGHYQFTPVMNGSIYNTPTASAVAAAKDVLENHENLVPSALVFYTPSKTPSGSWVRSQPVIAQYDDMVFAK